MADLTLPEVITRFRENEARIADFVNGNAAGYYTTTDGKKVETVPGVASRLASAIAAASATAETLKGTGGAKLVGYGATTIDAALTAQAKGIADNATAIADLDTGKLAKGGGTMTGALKLAGDPTDPLHAISKGWADGTYWKPGIGDVLATCRGAPDANWIPEGANYLQASYPDLFAKVGLLNYDGAGSAFAKGAAFSNANPLNVFGKDGVLMSTDTDPNGEVFYLLRSTDGGLSFAPFQSPTARITSIGTDGAGLWIAGSTVGRVLRSTDNGLTWTVINTGSGNDITGMVTDKKGCWIAVTSGAWVMRSDDSGLTWKKVALPLTYAANMLATNGAGKWIGIGPVSNTIYSSVDNGLTWTTYTLTYASENVSWSGVTYGRGVFGLVGAQQTNYGNYMPFGFSLDGFNWKLGAGSNYSNYQAWSIAIGKDGTYAVCGYTGGALRGVVSLDSKGAITWTGLLGMGVSGWPVSMATDGLGLWVAFNTSDRFLYRAQPLYDVKTLFQVPKAGVQPAPYANFIKAK
ncbi:hypothetical protein [Pseudomonas rhizoryzae]|uniref:hypothetical protein n=1 Tax=Pseudomonas rhizoryzae TaxID=2571129 RepID=UPI0007374B09|nr:hypothetical protein [Pseudomonas rhizoryzae]KTT33520.1 hypothetical protein SB9_13475 [Pseudomonas psychrotolerans]KTT73242.1 hypothetical protein SB18R_17710 [Pseudomonas psychrotolerans]